MLSQSCLHLLTLFIQRLAGLARDASTACLAADRLYLGGHASRRPARSQHHYVRGVDAALPLGDAALDLLGRIRTSMLLAHHDPFHQKSSGEAIDVQHASGLSLVPSRDHLDGVILLDADANRLFGRSSLSSESSASARHVRSPPEQAKRSS